MVLRLLFPIFLMFSVFILITQSLKLPVVTSNGTLGPGFLPIVLSLLIIVLLVIEVFSVFCKERSKDKNKISSIRISEQIFFLVAVIVTLGLVHVLGMLVSLGLFIFVILFKMEKRSLMNSSVFSLLSILIIYVIFDVLLGISFPMGLLN